MTGFRPSSSNWGQDASNIVDALNLCLQSKEVYDRAYQTILSSKQGKGSKGKQAYSFFGGYLQSAINRKLPELIDRVGVFNIDQPTIFDWINSEVMPLAIEDMFNAQVEEGVDPKLQNAYQELAQLAKQFDKSGSFAQQLGSIYRIDEVAEEVSQILASKTKLTKRGIGIGSLKNKHHTYTRGGLTLEAITDLIFSKLASEKGNLGHGITGGLGTKADNILTIGIDYSEVQDFLDSRELGTRKQNVEAFMALGQHLKNINDSFIVYSSAKNYSITDDFKSRGGFSAGFNLSLRQYEELMSKIERNMSVFIGAIEQLSEGAVGQDINKTDFADIISKDIAYLLFDDYDAIGSGLSNGANSIHIMNLNGLFLPISSILYALADAISSEQQIKGIVKTELKIPKIYFKDDEAQRNFEKTRPGEAWAFQREYALDNIQIETHFLGNLQEMLKYGKFR